MKIHSVVQIGILHTNHCEDFLVVEKIASEKLLIAVLDGCSMGKEAFFASSLFGKILRKIAKEKFYGNFYSQSPISLKSALKLVMGELFKQVKFMKNELDLETKELLTTIILGLVDLKERTAEFIAVGDGLIYKDGEAIEYDRDNRPDYLAYHLLEDFEEWFNRQQQFFSVSVFKDLAICTDGIFTFRNLVNLENLMTQQEIFKFLLEDKNSSDLENFLEKKVRQLKEEKNHVPMDDLTIIRIFN